MKILKVIILLALTSYTYADEASLRQSLQTIESHLLGNTTLTATQLNQEQTSIENDAAFFGSNTTLAGEGFDVVDLYDATYGAMFTNGSASDGGITRTATGNELEHVILTVMQGILDNAYTETNLQQNPTVFTNRKFETSSFFPGAVDAPANQNTSYTIQINGTHVRGFGIPANYETEDARRPTGTYLAPGSIATVTVPQSLVNIGASVLVGAHTWDLTSKPNIKRMDRVTTLFDITDSTVTVANPLGGGIYINIPYERDLGELDITIRNVVRSPYFANTSVNQTTTAQWQNVERQHTAPWADFESDKMMMQVPTSWIYAMDDPSSMMDDWDLSMDAISELFARPLIRPKTVVYQQVDVEMRGTANFPGYPQSNITYDPDRDYGGDHNNFLVNGPRNQTGYIPSVFFHELGHAENFHKFTGEVEASVNFLWVAVHNKKFGQSLDEAFSTSRYTYDHTIDEAAQTWMIAENFRNGNPMSNTTGQFQQEFAYQTRGYAKYADIVRLFGWEALEQFFYNLNIAYENGVRYNYHVSNVPWDEMSLRLSIAAGYDLTPLFHFWGIHPEDASQLAADIANNNLPASSAIYDLLAHYKTIVPQDNAAFRAFGIQDFGQNSINNYVNAFDVAPLSYSNGFFNVWWNIYDNTHAQAAETQIQNMIDLYYPNGRPETDTSNPTPVSSSFTPDPDKTYYIDSPVHNLRLAADGTSEDPYTTPIGTTGADVEWQFISKGNGYWHIQRAAGGTRPRLRTDGSEFADMQETSSSGIYTYYDFAEGASSETHFLTLPDGPTEYKRLQVDNGGLLRFVNTGYTGTWVSFDITEAIGSETVVHIKKRNAQDFAIDGNNGAANGQSVYLWAQNSNNVNQQWVEINRGDGYYSYQKQGTNYCLDGGNGGANQQDVYLWQCSDNNQNQHWQKASTDSGFYQLIKRNAPGFAINGGSNGENLQNVNLYDSTNASHNLQWSID